MTKLILEIHDDVVATINKIKNINDNQVELEIPQGSVIFENVLNLRLLKNYSENSGITVSFTTKDEAGNNLISSLEDNQNIGFISDPDENVTEVNAENLQSGLQAGAVVGSGHEFEKIEKRKFKFNFPKIGLPSIKTKKGIVPIFIILLAIGIYSIAGLNLPKAFINIVVESQPLTRSLTVKVKADTPSDSSQKILKGITLEDLLEETAEIDTTGQKLIGDKAKGKVMIYNNTDSDQDFDKGTVLIYEKADDIELKYELIDDITVPARSQLDPDPENPEIVSYKKGEQEAEVEAMEIGKDYNIDEDSSLTLDDYKSSQFNASATEDFEGGKSDTIKIVSQEDINSLKQKVQEQIDTSAESRLKRKAGLAMEYLKGSHLITIESEEFDKKLNDESEKLTLTTKAKVTALSYGKSDLDDLVDKLVEGFIPEGFALSDKERQVTVEILGNTAQTVLNSKEADIQVTLKTYTVPDINEESIKNDLVGKSIGDAQKYIGSIRNIKTYEFSVKPTLPPFNKVPRDLNRITVEIVRE